MKNLIALKRKREEKREWLIRQLGVGSKLDRLLIRLRKEMIELRTKLKRKYTLKLEHLETIRNKELEEKRQLLTIPDELVMFKDITIYDEIKRKKLKERYY